LAWFSKQAGEWQSFIERQNDRWQKAVDNQNNQWQRWLSEQSNRDSIFMDKVAISLENLTKSIEAHDDKVSDRFNQAITEVRKNGDKISKSKSE